MLLLAAPSAAAWVLGPIPTAHRQQAGVRCSPIVAEEDGGFNILGGVIKALGETQAKISEFPSKLKTTQAKISEFPSKLKELPDKVRQTLAPVEIPPDSPTLFADVSSPESNSGHHTAGRRRRRAGS
eukprot:89486-Prymnesium_polylepis.1